MDPFSLTNRHWFRSVVCLLSGFLVTPCFANDLIVGSSIITSVDQNDEVPLAIDECYACEPRKTLFQWSYGTSFEGGASLDEPLVTDRPDFTESSTAVGRGVVQLEMGYTYSFDQNASGSTNSESYPGALFRIGMFADWFELRLGWTYTGETQRVGSTRTRMVGAEDLVIGGKFALTPQEDALPEMAIIAQMAVPTGGSAFTANEVLPGAAWIYSWEINDCISTAGQSQVNWAIDDVSQRKYAEFSQSWTVAYSLTEQLGAYTEWYGLIPSGADTVGPQHFFNGGFTYLVNNDIQLDFLAGLGLNDAAGDYFVGSGLSYRF